MRLFNFIFFILLFSNVCAQRDSFQSELLNRHAALLLALDNNHKALVLLDSAILLDTLNTRAYANRSSAWDALGLTEEALEDINKAISLEPSNPDLYYNRALIYKNDMKHEATVKDLKRAIELDAKHLASINKLAYYYYQVRGDTDSSRKVIEDYYWQGITKTKMDADLIGLYGFLFMKEGKYKDAIREFDLALSIDSSLPEVLYNKAISHDHLDQYEISVKVYTKVIDIDPNNPDYNYNRAIAHSKLRNFDAAIQDYNRDIELNGPTARTFNNRGRCFMVLNEFQSAYEDYMHALELEPDRPLTLFNLGLLHFRNGQIDKGCEYIQKAEAAGKFIDPEIKEVCGP